MRPAHYETSAVRIEKLVVGPFENNVFVVRSKRTGDAVLLDAANEHERLLELCQRLGVRRVLETHGHGDHIQAVPAMREAGYEVAVTAKDAPMLKEVGYDVFIDDAEVIEVGRLRLHAIHNPGHTPGSVSFHVEGAPILFSGDTLFNAGAGNVHNGGNAIDLYSTFVEQLARLPDDTLVYPGHDYIENNLRFTLSREPGNADAEALLPEVSAQDPASGRVTTMAEEKHINTFLRLTSPRVIAALREAFPDLPENPDPKTVFVKLRELRNSW